MKMVKKILLGSLVLAAALALTSCGEKQDEEKAIKKDGTVKYTNNGKANYYRSFSSTSSKHYAADAVITIENADTLATTDGNVVSTAGFGFVFGLEEVTSKFPKVQTPKLNDDGTPKTNKKSEIVYRDVKYYTFGIAALRYNAKDKKAQYYISWVENVPDTVFNYNDSTDFEDKTLAAWNPGVTLPVTDETQCVPLSGAWKDIDTAELDVDENGTLVGMFKTEALDGGKYSVTLCKADETIIGYPSVIDSSITGLTKKEQKLIGRYITVYKNQTAKGSIKYQDVEGNVIPDEEYIVYE